MLDTAVFGFKLEILKVVIVVVFLLGALPFTEYRMVYWLRIPLSCAGSLQIKSTEKKFALLTRLRTIVGPANHSQYYIVLN